MWVHIYNCGSVYSICACWQHLCDSVHSLCCIPVLVVSVCSACWGRCSVVPAHSSLALSPSATGPADWLLRQNCPAYQHTSPAQSASGLQSDWPSASGSLGKQPIEARVREDKKHTICKMFINRYPYFTENVQNIFCLLLSLGDDFYSYKVGQQKKK